MAIAEGCFASRRAATAGRPHLPIDPFFRSLARGAAGRARSAWSSRARGSDGTLGLCEIKAAGGITFAQDERRRQHDGMPQQRGRQRVRRLRPAARRRSRARWREIGGHPYLRRPDAEARRGRRGRASGAILAHRAQRRRGVDFSSTATPRSGAASCGAWRCTAAVARQTTLELLEQDAGEVEALYHDLLINVTSSSATPSVRGAEAARCSRRSSSASPPTTPIRIWVPGCSTGQEAYSIAIALLEFLDEPARAPADPDLRHRPQRGRRSRRRAPGVYPESIEAEVSPERLRALLRQGGPRYRINKSIRDMCVFARQNMTADPPFSHLDLISCRNVLIYLSPRAAEAGAADLPLRANAPGFLVLGSSETVGAARRPVRAGGPRRTRSTPRRPAARPRRRRTSPPTTSARPAARAAGGTGGRRRRRDFQQGGRPDPARPLRAARRAGRREPRDPAVPRAHRRLPRAAAGRADHDLLKMAREGLFLELRNALARGEAARTQPVRARGRARPRRTARSASRPRGRRRSRRRAREERASWCCSRTRRRRADGSGAPAGAAAPAARSRTGTTTPAPSDASEIGAPAAGAGRDQGVPAVAGRGAGRHQRGAARRPTRRSCPATRSCRAPTRSWRPPRRSCSRPTRS